MEILQKDRTYILCRKEPGVLSTDEPGGVPALLRESLGEPDAELYTVHRLDRVVGGLMLLARSREAASALGKQLMERRFQKEYLAVVHGAPPARRGELHDFLLRDKGERKSYTVPRPERGAQEAVLRYEVLETVSAPASAAAGTEKGALSLVRVSLETGRTHQIRAQFSARGLPLVGDRKYGNPEERCGIALWSAVLAFDHPKTGARVRASLPPPERWPWTLFTALPAEAGVETAAKTAAGSGDGARRPEAARETEHAPCPHAKQCGGCQYQQLTYARQLALKESKVRRLLSPYCRLEPILGMDSPYHYRGKVQAAFGLDGKGRILSGVYQSSSHRIVPVDSCMIEDETADRIITVIRKMLPRFKIRVYDERRGTGWLRHVLVKRSFTTGEVMVVLVAASPVFPAKKHFLSALLEAFPEIVTVVLNVNDRYTSLVLGERETVLYGSGYITDELCGCRFRISPKSFYQVNPVQTEVLYRTALEFAALTGREKVLDAYCGTGTIGIAASRLAEQVAGVELNRDAVRDAIANARLNGAKNCWFTCADAGRFMEQASEAGERCDVVFMDPPRAGSDPRFLSSLLRLSPERIVYVSCAPETLARDLKTLVRGGYRVSRAVCVDMFPFTEHVETVVLMSKVK